MAFSTTDYDSFTRTRYVHLAVVRWGNVWRLADYTDTNNVATIGAPYRTKAEALADARYEADARGYKLA
jgi:hypothetical protein